MKRGFTLIELLISMALSAMLAASLTLAFRQALMVGPKMAKVRTAEDQRILFQETLTDLLEHTYVMPRTGATTPNTYFTTNPQANNSGLAQSSGQSQGMGPKANGGVLVFTALGLPTKQAILNDASGDFETQNQLYGPQGGIAEYEISLTPQGGSGDQHGVFIREQRPADNDPTQGGTQYLALPDVDNLTFEFWDGLQWQPSWDSLTQSAVRLPAAVRVTYSVGSATPTVFVVWLPNSNVTPTNPATDIGVNAPS